MVIDNFNVAGVSVADTQSVSSTTASRDGIWEPRGRNVLRRPVGGENFRLLQYNIGRLLLQVGRVAVFPQDAFDQNP